MKNIEQTFSKKIGDCNFHVTARNYNTHLFSYVANSASVQTMLNTDQMRQLAKHLTESADEIDKDTDFTTSNQ